MENDYLVIRLIDRFGRHMTFNYRLIDILLRPCPTGLLLKVDAYLNVLEQLISCDTDDERVHFNDAIEKGRLADRYDYVADTRCMISDIFRRRDVATAKATYPEWANKLIPGA
jgi:hypothetical protein